MGILDVDCFSSNFTDALGSSGNTVCQDVKEIDIRIGQLTQEIILKEPMKTDGKIRGGAKSNPNGTVDWYVELEYNLPFA